MKSYKLSVRKNRFPKLFNFKSIGKSVVFGFVIIILAMIIAVTGVTAVSLRFNSLHNNMLDSIIRANEICTSINEHTLTLVKQIGFDRKNIYANSESVRNTVYDNLTAINKMISDGNSEGRANYESLFSLVETYFGHIKEISEQHEIMTMSEVSERYDEIRKIDEFILNSKNNFVSSQLSYNQEIKEEVNKQFSYAINFTLGLILLIILFTVLYSYKLSSEISKGFKMLTEASEKIAGGNLNFKEVEIKSENELKILASAFNQMKKNLREITEKVCDVGISLSNVALKMKNNITDSAEASRQLSLSIQELAQGADTQAGDAENGHKAVESIVTALELISKTSKNVLQLSSQSKITAEESIESIKNYIDRIILINSVMDNTASSVLNLKNKSDHIGEITGVITNIAEQTRLLALNATIEAARAGKSGSGFAVIAQEVKKLSDQSYISANKIIDMVEAIQSETKTITDRIFVAAREVKEATELVSTTQTNLSKIEQSNSNVNGEIKNVDSSIEDVLNNIVTIKESTGNISEITQVFAANCEEAAASTEEQLGMLNHMMETSMVLADHALELKKLISEFQT